MKVALTGASGFLGGALAKTYRERGDEVVALVRNSADVSMLEELGVKLIYGELTEPENFLNLLDSADLGIHCAAMTVDFGPWEDFQAINIGGVVHFMEACKVHKCPKAVYISSVAVYGNGRNHLGTDEDAPYESIIIDNYTRSKIIAERKVFDYHQSHKIPVTIIRPGYIWGAGDRVAMPKMIDAIKTGKMAVVDGGVNLMNLAHVDNMVQGIMLAAEKDISIGRAYNLTDGSKVSTSRFFKNIVDIVGVDYRLRSFPYVPVYVAAYFCELYAIIRRYKIYPPLTRYTVRMGKYDQVFDISRAMYELGYKPRILYNEGMARMISYIRGLYYGQK
ncbi:MAG: NAD-dependent epimerase/dehydratase family protein [candidate division Zixibacteria bacterium]|nr:NAD-dependent epimerase/dehydratase family protein [candidate division Zixibacteria bacterium]